MSDISDLKLAQESTSDLPMALFDPAADVLLDPFAKASGPIPDQIELYFREYFGFAGPQFDSGGAPQPADGRRNQLFNPTGCAVPQYGTWPIPLTCVRLDGVRGNWDARFQRLRFGDLVWLYYIERMGIFSILGAILDDFASSGRYPIPSDTLPGAILETMVREMSAGVASSSRARLTAYRRCLGWSLPNGSALPLDDVIPNAGFDGLMHGFIRAALDLFVQRRLSDVINGNAQNRPSMATLISVRDTLRLLKHALEPITYGRMYTTTLNGIVWAVSGFAVLRDIRFDLGIPQSYKTAEDYVPAAYNKLVSRDESASADRNRFRIHHDCATYGRDILLDVEVFPDDELKNPSLNGMLFDWLLSLEDTIEGYRTAYRALTGIDLGPAVQARSLQPA